MARGKGGGRPSKYSPELVEAICARLKQGEPLAQICRDKGMPDPSTVWDWQQSKPDVAQSIARAREIGEDVIAADCLRIVDNTDEDPASRRVRADTRLKLLAKWNPKRWGEKVQQDVTVRHTADELPDDELARIAGSGRS